MVMPRLVTQLGRFTASSQGMPRAISSSVAPQRRCHGRRSSRYPAAAPNDPIERRASLTWLMVIYSAVVRTPSLTLSVGYRPVVIPAAPRPRGAGACGPSAGARDSR